MPMSAWSVPILRVRVPVKRLLTFVALAYATLLVASVFTRVDAWYESLSKPSWTPPGWLIGSVWTILYTLIGISSAVAWGESDSRLGRPGFAAILVTNLILNATWSLLFFTLHMPGLAFGEVVLLAASTVGLCLAAGIRSRTAGWLLAPYAVWVGFASVLNYTIWRLNA